MTKTTTALIALGPATISPWGDEAWRIGLTVQLVEGGSPAYWLSNPTLEPLHSVHPLHVDIEVPDEECTFNALLLSIAVQVGGEKIEHLLLETHNIALSGRVREIAPYWDLSDDLVHALGLEIAGKVRIAVTLLDEQTLMTKAVIAKLRSLGISVSVFISAE